MRWLAGLVLLGAVASAQLETGTPLSNGIVSFIEDLPDPLEPDPRRKLPFVEVIDTAALERCRETGLDSPDCPTFEYSVPFVPRASATAVERAVVDAWLRFELRSFHRGLLEIGAHKPLIACTLGALDLRWLIYRGELFFPASEFCDGAAAVIPNCLLLCDLPTNVCPSPPAACTGCVADGLARARAHALRVYYPDYAGEVLEALGLNLPLALHWQSPLLGAGASIAPVADAAAPIEAVSRMARAAAGEDPRAPLYFFQAGALASVCQPYLPEEALRALRRRPGEAFDLARPGIPALEAHKRRLADRESAGDTWVRFDWWWLGPETIYPTYARSGGNPWGGGEPATLALGLPTFYACLSYVPFLAVYQRFDVVVRAFPGYQRPASCLRAGLPPLGLTLVPPAPIPFTFEGPRFHTDWVSVPEGYDIPRVQGTPLDLVPSAP